MWRSFDKSIRRKLRRRRFHAYCVGAAKTGTTTIAGMFRPRYLAAHEPDTVASIRMVIDHLTGQLNVSDLRQALQARDSRLHLELESSHPFGYLVPVLHDLFPTARFIVTIREPFSWLRSRVNFHGHTDPPKWREYRQFFWYEQQRGYEPEESPLREHGLVSLDVYLRQYAEHYRLVFEGMDPMRAIVLKTPQLSDCRRQLAAFLGVAFESLDTVHQKRARGGVDILGMMDEDFVRKKILEHCQDLLQQWFPETLATYGLG